MIKLISGAVISTVMLAAPAWAFNGAAYEGTWSGQLSSGKPVVLSIPAGVESGAAASYSFDNADQGPQTPTVQGKKIKFSNPQNGNYVLVGPVKGDRLPYFWTDGSHKASTILIKQ